MSLEKRKESLIKWIDSLKDEASLQRIEEVFAKWDQEMNEIIGYSPTGKPFRTRDLIKRVKSAEKDLESGDFTTHEDLKKEIQTWKENDHLDQRSSN